MIRIYIFSGDGEMGCSSIDTPYRGQVSVGGAGGLAEDQPPSLTTTPSSSYDSGPGWGGWGCVNNQIIDNKIDGTFIYLSISENKQITKETFLNNKSYLQ